MTFTRTESAYRSLYQHAEDQKKEIAALKAELADGYACHVAGHVLLEARAEKAEARVAELEKELWFWQWYGDAREVALRKGEGGGRESGGQATPFGSPLGATASRAMREASPAAANPAAPSTSPGGTKVSPLIPVHPRW